MSSISNPHTAALGLTSLTEVNPTPRELAVHGELPTWLTGSLLRTGPAVWEVGTTRLRHWFDGLAMLHHFSIDDGHVRYANRHLEGRTYRASREAGRIAFREFATDPCRSIFQRVQSLFTPSASLSDNANVNVGRLGDRFVAMTETPIPVEFDRRTLTAAGTAFPVPGTVTTAHPHYERGTGAMLNYTAKLGPRSSYRFFRVDPADASTELITELPVRQPAYMHSFGITEHFFVLTEFPLVVNPAALAVSGKPFIENYRWKPELGTRFTLIDRHDGSVRARGGTDACFAFHHVNAYEEGSDVVVDLCAAEDATIVDELYLDRLRDRMRDGDTVLDYGHPRLTRYRMSTRDGVITTEGLGGHRMELPVVNHRERREREHRYVWGVSTAGDWLDRIVKVDVRTHESLIWREDGCYPGEPVFVPRPDDADEDGGVLLSVVLDANRATSFLLVLDAATLEETARADVGHHIPYGFHGTFTRS